MLLMTMAGPDQWRRRGSWPFSDDVDDE